jgi:hypothetical protein
LAEAGADRVVVDVVAVSEEVISVTHAAVGETALPGGELRGQAAGETAFDELDRAFEGDAGGGEEKVNVVGHDDEGVEFVVAFAAVVLEGFEEEFG